MSSRTGFPPPIVWSKLPSVIVCTLSDAMGSSPGSIAFIHFDISPGGNVPGEVPLHGCALDPAPPVRVAERRQRALDGVDQRFSLVLAKLEPGAPLRNVVGVHHRVFQAAGGADNRDGRVAEAVHLVEAARFV